MGARLQIAVQVSSLNSGIEFSIAIASSGVSTETLSQGHTTKDGVTNLTGNHWRDEGWAEM
jgi:hypothetical protein